MINNVDFIEIMIETHNQEDVYYTDYQRHMFFTCKKYSHDELVKVMKSITQKTNYNEDIYATEIDYNDLKNQLSAYEIYELCPVERYCFDIEEE